MRYLKICGSIFLGGKALCAVPVIAGFLGLAPEAVTLSIFGGLIVLTIHFSATSST